MEKEKDNQNKNGKGKKHPKNAVYLPPKGHQTRASTTREPGLQEPLTVHLHISPYPQAPPLGLRTVVRFRAALPLSELNFLFFVFFFFFLLIPERGEGREKEERNIDGREKRRWVASCTSPD